MCPARRGATIVVSAPAGRSMRAGRSRPIARGARQEIAGMERTDWLDAGLDPTDARFLMMTAITHHQFSAPVRAAPGRHLLGSSVAPTGLLRLPAMRQARPYRTLES